MENNNRPNINLQPQGEPVVRNPGFQGNSSYLGVAMKKSFILYTEWGNAINALRDEQAGRFFKSLFDYESRGKITFTSKLMPLFLSMKTSLDRNTDKYFNIVKKNRSNIKKRWLNHTKNTTGKVGIPEILDSDSENNKHNNSSERKVFSPMATHKPNGIDLLLENGNH